MGGLARHGKQNRLGHMTEELQKKKKNLKDQKKTKARSPEPVGMNPNLSRWLGMVGKGLVEESWGIISTSESIWFQLIKGKQPHLPLKYEKYKL